jgi:hypothetical protein
MATISNTPRPGYVWDATDNVWYPIGTGPHTHPDYITQSTAINPAIVDAKGDIIAASAADTVARLAVGANNTVLTADSSTATGLKWATPAAGGMTLISETTASALTGLSLSSIPQTYKQLMLVWEGIYLSAEQPVFYCRFNNNSTSDPYAVQFTVSTGNDKSLVYTGNYNDATYSDNYTSLFGYDVNASTEYHRHAKGYMIIDNYTSTSKFKHYWTNWSWYFPGYAAGQRDWTVNGQGTYKSTTAITSIDFTRSSTGTFSNAANTSIRLYGIS